MAKTCVIPYGKQSIDSEDVAGVVDILNSDYLTTGPKIAEFELALAEYTRQKYAVGVSSGTAALHCLYQAAEVGEGNHIITTPLTFAATASAAILLGADVVFCDIDEHTGLISAQEISDRITDQTKAVVPVDYAGHPADYENIRKSVINYSALVFRDGCHSLGSRVNDIPTENLADASIFSFHPVKPITTGEGGAIVTNSKPLANGSRLFANHGIVRNPQDLEMVDEPWRYDLKAAGLNYRLTDIQSALGLSQLKKLERFRDSREKIANRYMEQFEQDSRLLLPPNSEDVTHSWHLFVLRFRDGSTRRLQVYNYLKSKNIFAQIHYVPLHLQSFYADRGWQQGQFPNTESWYDCCLSLPIYPDLTMDQVDFVVDTVFEALTKSC